MRRAFIGVGLTMVVLGTLLPWVSVSTPMGSGARNGLELNQGMIGIAAGVLGSLLGFISSGRSNPARIFSSLTALSGLVVVAMAVSVLMELGSQGSRMSTFPGVGSGMSAMVSAQMQPGVILALIGGVVLGIGGLLAMRAASES